MDVLTVSGISLSFNGAISISAKNNGLLQFTNWFSSLEIVLQHCTIGIISLQAPLGDIFHYISNNSNTLL